MAYSSAALAAYESARFALDKPVFLTQAIPISPTSAKWHNSGSTTDRTDPDYPARRAYDGLPGFVTKPTTVSADKEWYYELGISAAGVEFDALAIIGHNLGTLHAGGALTVTLEVSDAANFAGAVSVPITVTAGASNYRMLILDLHHTGAVPLRYSAVRYARIKIIRGATNFTPEIGELLLLRRRQMKYAPSLPYDPTSLHSVSETARTMGGVNYRTSYASGFYHLSATLVSHESGYVADAIAAFRDTNYGTHPFVWLPLPTSAPTSWYLLNIDDPDFDYPVEGLAKRTWQLEATEQGPENYYVSRGVY